MREAENFKFFKRERKSRGESGKAIVIEMKGSDSVGEDI